MRAIDTNVLVRMITRDDPRQAAKADAFLMQGGIILRSVASYGLPDCLRMTIGTEEQNRLVVSLLQKFMAQ